MLYRDSYIIPYLKKIFLLHFKILNDSEVATYSEKISTVLHAEKENARAILLEYALSYVLLLKARFQMLLKE